MKRAFIFPGQGAQYPGMGKDFYDQFAVAREVFDEADALLGRAFSNLIFYGSKEELALTSNSQIAIYLVSVAILRVLQQEMPDFTAHMCGGLSLGEYTALMASGKIGFKQGLELVRSRGLFMHEASLEKPGTMAAVLGLGEEDIAPLLGGKDVWIANLNCPGQVVISGTKSGIEAIMPTLKEAGAKRVIPLDVSGAFHSELMASARERLKVLIEDVPLVEGDIDLVMNVPGTFVVGDRQVRDHLVAQVTSPVRWESCIRCMAAEGVTLFVEIGCGKTLSGMNRKILPIETISIEIVSDLDKLFVGRS